MFSILNPLAWEAQQKKGKEKLGRQTLAVLQQKHPTHQSDQHQYITKNKRKLPQAMLKQQQSPALTQPSGTLAQL